MAGFSSVTGDEAIMFADNASFDGTQRGGKMTQDGELWIGSTAARHVKKGLPTGQGYLGNTPIMTAIYGSGTLAYENRSWIIPYVVDASTTVGSRATFTTIQGAINQVVADGFTLANGYIPIAIRKGLYTENLVIPSNVFIYLYGINSDGAAVTTQQVIIVGNLTFTATSSIVSDGIDFNSGGSGNAINLANSSGVSIVNGSVDTITGSTGVRFINSNIDACTLSGGTNTVNKCTIGNNTCQFSGGTTSISNSLCGNLQVTSAPTLQVLNCVFSGSSSISSTGTFTGTVIGENIIAGSTTLFNITGGTVRYSNITIPSTTSTNIIGATTPTTFTSLPHFGGNVKHVRKTAISTAAVRGDMYIGVTDTSAARTITLPNASPTASSFYLGQQLTIKDEGGLALVNNITITPASGTVDGAASIVINTNYGKANVIFDGTNWWSI